MPSQGGLLVVSMVNSKGCERSDAELQIIIPLLWFVGVKLTENGCLILLNKISICDFLCDKNSKIAAWGV